MPRFAKRKHMPGASSPCVLLKACLLLVRRMVMPCQGFPQARQPLAADGAKACQCGLFVTCQPPSCADWFRSLVRTGRVCWPYHSSSLLFR
jgi:hypothetical protein